jgi:HlyD family secretion protein
MIGVAAVVVSATGSVALMRPGMFQSAGTNPVTETMQVTGSVQPVSETPLDFGVGGEVLSVNVKEGQMVDAGTVLATLDQAPLLSQQAQAQGTLGSAQAKLAQDEIPVPADTLAAGLGTAATAQDQVNSAQAALLDTERTTQQDVGVAQQAANAAQDAGNAAVVAAQQQVSAAQANLADVVLANQEAVAGAQLAVAQAQQTADANVATATAQVAAAQAAVADAQRTGQANVLAAQAAAKAADATVVADQRTVAADQAKLHADQSTANHDCAVPPTPPATQTPQCSTDRQTVSADQRQVTADQATVLTDQAAAQSAHVAVTQAQAQAQTAVDQARTQLATASVNLRTATAARVTNVLAAQNALAQEVARGKGGNDQAQVVLNAALSGLRSAQALLATGVRTAQATLGQALASNDQAQATLNAAKVALQNAQRTVDALGRGPIPQLIAGDQKAVDAGQAQVTLSQHNVDASTIVAPLRGFVEHLNTFVGATVSAPGTQSKTNHAIVLYTPGAFTVTGAISDAQIGKVRLGDRVSVVPAGSTTSIAGAVTQVSPAATVRNGVPMYDVTATLQPTSLNLPPAGRASMTITVRRTTSAVVVPNGAVRRIGQWNVVMVPGVNQPLGRPVTLGASDSKDVEITGGLAPGQPILVK